MVQPYFSQIAASRVWISPPLVKDTGKADSDSTTSAAPFSAAFSASVILVSIIVCRLSLSHFSFDRAFPWIAAALIALSFFIGMTQSTKQIIAGARREAVPALSAKRSPVCANKAMYPQNVTTMNVIK